MARVGRNPLSSSPAQHRTSAVVLSAITHLPNEQGYHLHRLEVIKTSLLSMRRNAGGVYDVTIWDNGSCPALREWLIDEYKPTTLILSPNVGKSAARLGLTGGVSPETIINVSDDDIYYYPDWLQPQIDLLVNIPSTACVTGYPLRTSFRWGAENTIKRMSKSGATLKQGRFLPDAWEDDYAVSIGRDKNEHRQSSEKDNEILAELKGYKFYLTSHHCQHIGYAGMLRTATLKTLMLGAMPDEKPYDRMLDTLGNRLATAERLTRHIGNMIDEDLRRDMEAAEKW